MLKEKPFFQTIQYIKKSVNRFIDKFRSFNSMSLHFLPQIRQQNGKIILSLLSGVGYILFGMLEPWPLKLIFDNVFLNEPFPLFLQTFFEYFNSSKLTTLNILIGFMILIAVIRSWLYYIEQQYASRAGQKIASGIRLDLYNHLQRLSFSFHDRRKMGDILSRLSSDINILRSSLIPLPLTSLTDLFLVAAMIFVMAIMDIQLTLIACMVIPILMMLMKTYRTPMKHAMKTQREKESHLSNLATEGLRAIKVVQGFHRQAYEVSRFGKQNSKSLSTGLKATRLEAKLNWGSEFSIAIITALVLAVAARRVLGGAISPGELLVFAYYLRTFNRPLKRISKITEQMCRTNASGERISDLMHIPPGIKENPLAKIAPKFKGEICYKNVSFEYLPGTPILKNINFTILPGKKILFSGPSGAGKSTLASLLPRFYDCANGEILIDGIDIRNWTLKSLRKQISVIFQEPVLFATSIFENIAYGKPHATKEEIVDMAKRLQIHDKIQALPKGYETIVGERGKTLSGGQRQYIAILRSMMKNAPIIILDEPTASLDKESAMIVMRALEELVKGKTVILISHQQELIQNVDQIYNISIKSP